jgi:poly [ADP-ribose] polymerase
MVLKGGNVVDPDCELHDVTHVLKDGEDIYNAILNKVDLTVNKNSYYKLQVLEHDSKKKNFYVFRAWGRVGTTIGSNKLEKFRTKDEAIEHFKELYLEKTLNEWENRKNFQKQPNSFFPVDVDYGADEQIKKLVPGNSRLPKPVQDLICMIFDVQKMKEAMLEFELDLEKMPLGKLSKKQLLNACSVLKEISHLIETKPPNNTKLTDASNRFYTLVPHNFGTSRPPLIDSEDAIKAKMEMLESLLDIEMAYEMMTTDGSNPELDPIDQQYEKLNALIEPLSQEHEDFSIVKKYVENTHAPTHDMKLEILEVFKVERHGEYERYKKFKDLDNKMLLWHGSRVTNYPGIISQGLRIAPPEAPVTGYMFGKGIYFADMVSKSANYCYAHMNKNVGLLLLSEVAIGEPYVSNFIFNKLNHFYYSLIDMN